jgi:hypothetical protein
MPKTLIQLLPMELLKLLVVPALIIGVFICFTLFKKARRDINTKLAFFT